MSTEEAQGGSGGAAAAGEGVTPTEPVDPRSVDWLEKAPNSVKYYSQEEVLDPDNNDAGEFHQGIFGEADAASYQVRGPNYLVDKVKEPSRPSMFTPVDVAVFVNSKPMPNIAKRSPLLRKAVSDPKNPFAFIVTWLIPGPPHYTVVMVFTRSIPKGVDPKFDKLFESFVRGEDDVSCRRARFKFIPNIVKAPFLVNAALTALGGMRPVIIGNKLENQYFIGPNHMELVINISSSKVAASVTHICLGSLKKLIVDLGFVLEAGHEPDFEAELPERMLGQCRFKQCDLKASCQEVDFDVSDVE